MMARIRVAFLGSHACTTAPGGKEIHIERDIFTV
jgi:hypothetical protein